MAECQHWDLVVLESRGGRMQWVCSCGRMPETKAGTTREELIEWMKAFDTLRGILKDDDG